MTAKPTLYQRYTDAGTRQHNRAGVAVALAGGGAGADAATWAVRADALAGLVPLPGRDYLRDPAGGWWAVEGVGPPVDGVYPLQCVRWKDCAA